MTQTPAERMAAYRKRQRARGKPDSSRTYAKEHRKTYRQKKSPGSHIKRLDPIPAKIEAPDGTVLYNPLDGEVTKGV